MTSGKYNSPRDELLDVMCLEGWANQSTGDVESPTGYFSLIVNSAEEMHEVRQAFEDEAASIAEQWHDTAERVLSSIQGNFIVTQSSLGFVYVHQYELASNAEADYAALEDSFAEWMDE